MVNDVSLGICISLSNLGQAYTNARHISGITLNFMLHYVQQTCHNRNLCIKCLSSSPALTSTTCNRSHQSLNTGIVNTKFPFNTYTNRFLDAYACVASDNEHNNTNTNTIISLPLPFTLCCASCDFLAPRFSIYSCHTYHPELPPPVKYPQSPVKFNYKRLVTRQSLQVASNVNIQCQSLILLYLQTAFSFLYWWQLITCSIYW